MTDPRRPILSTGSADPDVELLRAALAEAGYDTTPSVNPNVVDDGLMSAVRSYRGAHDVDRLGVPEYQIGPGDWAALFGPLEDDDEGGPVEV